MSPTIRSLVIPVSDINASKGVYTALLGAPHTDEAYYVGFNVDGFEVGLAPGDVSGGPVTSLTRGQTGHPAVSRPGSRRSNGCPRGGPEPLPSLMTVVQPCSRPARRSAAPRSRSRPTCASASSRTPTAIRSACAANSGRVRASGPDGRTARLE